MTEGTRLCGVGVMQSQDVDVLARSYPWLGVYYYIYVWLEGTPSKHPASGGQGWRSAVEQSVKPRNKERLGNRDQD
jgi:hypothetical protein